MTAEECRNLADKHRRRAQAEPDPAKRDLMFTRAAEYEALAAAAEQDGKPPHGA
jgi:hypothetical protein